MKREREPDGLLSPPLPLDDLLQHRVRLTTAVLLCRHDRLSFSRLKDLLDQTDGSLGAHLRRLEDAAYVTARKQFQGRRPVTWYVLTATGKRALTAHLDALGRLIAAANGTS